MALLGGMGDVEAKERGIVAAIMGAKARLGYRAGTHEDDFKALRDAAEGKKKARALKPV